jgi:NADPH2 dehydrogenase
VPAAAFRGGDASSIVARACGRVLDSFILFIIGGRRFLRRLNATVPSPRIYGYETPEHPLIGVDRHFRLTAGIQRAFPDLAVVGSGYSWLQPFAPMAGAANVRAGRTTFVGIGRGALSQPDFGRRIMEGEALDPKRLCRTFSYCTALMRSKHNDLGQFATGCPPFDKEVYGPIWDEARR